MATSAEEVAGRTGAREGAAGESTGVAEEGAAGADVSSAGAASVDLFIVGQAKRREKFKTSILARVKNVVPNNR
jgi:flagellar basal body L-ring protein FlgH